MSEPYVYSGPPGRGFEPGTTYDLTYPPAADDWRPVTSAPSNTPSAPTPAPVAAESEPTEPVKEPS